MQNVTFYTSFDYTFQIHSLTFIMAFTVEQKVFCVNLLMKGFSSNEVPTIYLIQFPAPAPNSRTTLKWLKKLNETGSVHNKKQTGRPPVKEDVIERVRIRYQEEPRLSIRRGAKILKIPPSTLNKIVKKHLKLFPYKIKILQSLKEGDNRRRLDFCEGFLQKFPNIETGSNVWFSDESGFHLKGWVNKQNYRYWASSNPHEFIKEFDKETIKLNVWACISPKGIIGPFFFRSNIKGTDYLDMLQRFVLPEIGRRNIEQMYYQQDGAPPHYLRAVRDYLNEKFLKK